MMQQNLNKLKFHQSESFTGRVASYSDIYLSPLLRSKVGSTFGAMLVDGTIVPELAISKTYDGPQHAVMVDLTDRDSIETIEQSSVFGGFIYPHFGHFILETLNRLWFVDRLDERKIIFLSKQSRLLPWQKDIFDLLGVSQRIKIIEGITKFNNLVCPTPGVVLSKFISREFCFSTRVFECNSVRRVPKLWLSRTSWHKGTVENENELEDKLEAQGWVILKPELHPISYQLEVIGSADVVGGFEGSATHMLLLQKNTPERLILIPRIFPKLGLASTGFPRPLRLKSST